MRLVQIISRKTQTYHPNKRQRYGHWQFQSHPEKISAVSENTNNNKHRPSIERTSLNRRTGEPSSFKNALFETNRYNLQYSSSNIIKQRQETSLECRPIEVWNHPAASSFGTEISSKEEVLNKAACHKDETDVRLRGGDGTVLRISGFILGGVASLR